MSTNNKKDDFIKIKISTTDKEQLQQMAASKKMSLSAFCREKIFDNETLRHMERPMDKELGTKMVPGYTKAYFRLSPEEMDTLKILSEEMRISKEAVVKRLIAKSELTILEPQFDYAYEYSNLENRIETCNQLLLSILQAIRDSRSLALMDVKIMNPIKECHSMLSEIKDKFVNIEKIINKSFLKSMNSTSRKMTHEKIKQKAAIRRKKELLELIIQTCYENNEEDGEYALTHPNEYLSHLYNAELIDALIQMFEPISMKCNTAKLLIKKLTEWKTFYI